MKFDNEDLTCIADNTLEYIECAIGELDGVKEYKDIAKYLEDIKSELYETSETYREKYYKECEQELKYQNYEYERSRF